MFNILTASGAMYYLQTYGYVAMFFLFIAESQVLVFLAAFGASQGFFNVYIVAVLSFVGIILPDIVVFHIGRRGLRIARKISESKSKRIGFIKKLVSYVEEKPIRSIAIIKILPIIPWPGLILTGTTKISFKKFILISAFISLFECAFFVVAGYYSGIAFNVFARDFKLGGYALLIILAIGLAIWYIFDRASEKVAHKIEENITN